MENSKENLTALFARCGKSRQDVAKELGAHIQTVHAWFNRFGGKVPAERCIEVQAVLGCSFHELRPDVYPSDF